MHTVIRPTPGSDGQAGAEEVWAAVAATIADALSAAGGAVAAVGVASAGPIDLHSGSVSPVNIRSWRAFSAARQGRRGGAGRARAARR